MFKDDFVRIAKLINDGDMDRDIDESGTGGFWDLSYEIYGKELVDNDDEQEVVESIYNALWDLHDTLKSDDIEMLERENKAMADALSKLGYTQEQISDIANGAI